MEIINAAIPCDLSVYAIENALLELRISNISEVILVCSSSYSFHYIFNLINIDNKDKNVSTINLLLSNIDTSEMLEKDSWMLIDYKQKKMYYSPGA